LRAALLAAEVLQMVTVAAAETNPLAAVKPPQSEFQLAAAVVYRWRMANRGVLLSTNKASAV